MIIQQRNLTDEVQHNLDRSLPLSSAWLRGDAYRKRTVLVLWVSICLMTSERHRMVVIDRCKSIGPTTCVQVGSIRLRIDPARPLLDGQSRRMSVAICFPCVAKAVAAAAALRWVRQVSEI